MMLQKITGVMVQYYVACKRELWFFSRQIEADQEDENILLGKFISETSYPRERKNILIDDTIAPDFIKKSNDQFLVFEVKKSKKLEKAAKMQVYYYLWYLKNKKGLDTEAIIVYPLKKKRERLKLRRKYEKEIDKIFSEILKIVEKKSPPKKIKKPYCRKCAYYELCWV